MDYLQRNIKEHLFWERCQYSKWQFSEVQLMIVRTWIAQDDEDLANKLIADWMQVQKKPMTTISKYYPGQHYYVLGRKFYSRSAAEDYASEQGYEAYPNVFTNYVPQAGD